MLAGSIDRTTNYKTRNSVFGAAGFEWSGRSWDKIRWGGNSTSTIYPHTHFATPKTLDSLPKSGTNQLRQVSGVKLTKVTCDKIDEFLRKVRPGRCGPVLSESRAENRTSTARPRTKLRIFFRASTRVRGPPDRTGRLRSVASGQGRSAGAGLGTLPSKKIRNSSRTPPIDKRFSVLDSERMGLLHMFRESVFATQKLAFVAGEVEMGFRR